MSVWLKRAADRTTNERAAGRYSLKREDSPTMETFNEYWPIASGFRAVSGTTKENNIPLSLRRTSGKDT